MKKLFLLRREICIIILLLLTGTACRSKRETVEQTNSTETHTVTHLSQTVTPDTLVYRLAPQYQERIVHDTVSVLTNDYAQSRVTVLPNGSLLHSLDSRDRVVYVPVQTVKTVTDTVYTTSSQTRQQTILPVHKKSSTLWWTLSLLAIASIFFLLIKFVGIRKSY